MQRSLWDLNDPHLLLRRHNAQSKSGELGGVKTFGRQYN
jgi:hypothetical protein